MCGWMNTNVVFFSFKKVNKDSFSLHTHFAFIPWSFYAKTGTGNGENLWGCQVIRASLPVQCPQHLPYAPGTRWWQWVGWSPSSARPLATHSLLSSGRGRAARWDWPSVCHRTKSQLSANKSSEWVSNAMISVSPPESTLLLPATTAL